MSPSRFARVRIGKPALISICIVFVAIALAWTTSQPAGAAASSWRTSRSAGRLSAADKGGITPAAATIVVNSTSDVANGIDGLCTLREAINAANDNVASGPTFGECTAGSNSGSDTIDLTGLTGTINLASALTTLQAGVNITGPGASVLTIQRSSAAGTTNFPVFKIFVQGPPNPSEVFTFSGVTIANGNDPVAYGSGLQILTANTINVIDCIITNNAAFRGAGIYLETSGTVNVVNTAIRNNSTTGQPTVDPQGGAAIFNASTGSVNVINSTLNNNTANSPGAGGAIYNNNGFVKVINSTISGNSATNGGGIHNLGGTIDINNCTIAHNTATGRGGGVFNNGIFRTRNSIIALNTGATGPDFNTSITSEGHNLIGTNDGGAITPVSGDLIGTNASPIDPLLGPLQNNGGPTQTLALLTGSPALDAGDDCVTTVGHCADGNVSQLATDQRGAGFNRMVDGPDGDATATVDIGAYEMQTPLANLPDTSTNEDTRLVVAFDGGDPSTITSVTAISSDATLVPNDAAHLSVVMTGSTGALTINPAANLSGPTNITVTINRTGGPESKTFLLTVNPVNDAPSFTKGADQAVNEDAGAQTVSNWATGISAGPNESGQVLTFQVTVNTNAALFSAGPAIDAGGNLTYTPAANANGSATITINLKDNGGIANGGADTSASQSFTVTVTPVNDPPAFTKGADQTVNEDAGAQTVTNWATGLSRGPADESGQTLTFQITNNTNAALFSAGPAVSSTGALTYTPAANANGSATITINLKDNGGTANGGVDTSASQTFVINVNAVNDVPSFVKGANQTVDEDAGAQTVSNWATSISTGPANESGQAVTFQVTGNTNAALFSTAPAISSTGTLTYTPAANANGSANLTINLKDDGGTANGGVDTSASQTFTITVNAVNDVPSFTKGADQTVNNNAGPQTVTNWATNISAGPSNESGQTLTFQFTGNTNPGLFTSGPAVSSSGTLTYTPSSSGGGTATLTINLKDNGGTANGGVDTSASQTFTITVTPVGGFVSFASSTGNTTENSGTTTVNVVRTGDTSKAVTVNYATNADSGVPCSTANGVASPKCDFTAALGTLSFAAGETSKPITILISQDSFVEGPETITLTLSSPTGNAALGTPSSMAVTIADDASEPPSNIIDDPNMFVRMHYHDFLNREADQSGLDFWTGQMTNCGNSDLTVCRVNVSGAFFLSIEFQQTGYLVERMYKTGYGDATGTSQLGGSHQIFVPVVRANEFLADTQRVGRGVVVGQTGWETVLENNKQAYLLEFVQTSRFITAFPTSMTPAQFVDKLNTNAGNVLSASERQTAINLFGNAATTTNVNARAQALRQVAEDQDLYNAEFNRAFVLTEYIGYLRRNPNDAPESTLDYSGYDFWLGKLNQFNGDYIAAEMVKAFISSGEYRQRFGPG